MSQRQIARLLGVRISTTNEQLTMLKFGGVNLRERKKFELRREGRRIIKRRVLHYPLDIALSVAIKTGNVAAVKKIRRWARENEIRVTPHVISRPERHFAELLSCVSEIVTIYRQHKIGEHRVDFFIPEIQTAIEFDEPAHQKPKCLRSDKDRELNLRSTYGIEFIRVTQGKELEGLKRIICRIMQTLTQKESLTPVGRLKRSIEDLYSRSRPHPGRNKK